VESSEPQTLSWEEIAGAAREMFNVWVDQPELRWARNAWELLSLVGLTRYSNPAELTIVKLRLMALSAFYRDFCYVAWQEQTYPMYVLWSEELSLAPIRVGQLLGDSGEWNEVEDESLLSDGLTHLVTKERRHVGTALIQAYGVSSLLCALYNSNRQPIPPKRNQETEEEIDESICYEETPDYILNHTGDELGPAYTWLDQGAEPLLECGG
jgi:hypothetical protein